MIKKLSGKFIAYNFPLNAKQIYIEKLFHRIVISLYSANNAMANTLNAQLLLLFLFVNQFRWHFFCCQKLKLRE